MILPQLSIYIDNYEIGVVDFKVADWSMGVAQGIMTPTKLYISYVKRIQSSYLAGLGEDNEEHKQLKKVRPTSNDLYSLSKIDDFMGIDHGLFGRLTRLSDKKRFSMPLVEFMFVDKDSKTFDLLDDYRYWFINYK